MRYLIVGVLVVCLAVPAMAGTNGSVTSPASPWAKTFAALGSAPSSGAWDVSGYFDTSGFTEAVPGGWASGYGNVFLYDGARYTQFQWASVPLGSWHGIPAQTWDRARIEADYGAGMISSPETNFATEGGTTDIGDGSGGTYEVYPTDQNYFLQLQVDPTAGTNGQMTAHIWDRGSSGQNVTEDPSTGSLPPNYFDEDRWHHFASWDFDAAWDWSSVSVHAMVMTGGHPAGSGIPTPEQTFSYWDVQITDPIDMEYGSTPPRRYTNDSPEPATWVLLIATGAFGAWRRRRSS